MLNITQMKGHTSSKKADVGPIAWVRDERALGWLIHAIDGASEVVFDLETTGLDEHAVSGGASNDGVAARVSMASFTLPQRAAGGRFWDGSEPTSYVLPLSHPSSTWQGKWRRTLREVMAAAVQADRPIIGHNVKFDARWIYATTGVDISERITWDTMVSAHLLDENESTKLKERAPQTFGVERWDDHDLSYAGASEDVPLEELGEYAARDTYWTWRLYVAHREQMFLRSRELEDIDPPIMADEIQDARLGTLAEWVAMPTTRALTKMEQRGIKLDLDWTRQKLTEDRGTAAELMDRIVDEYGGNVPGEPSLAPTSKWFQAFTEEAVREGNLEVMSMTRRGKPQWSKSVLKKNTRHGSTLAQLILDQRAASKRSEFLTSWLEQASPDGRIHANYRAGHVVTGRLSSANPNMQQVTYALRPAFVPSEGYVLVDLDYSQIELRVAAFISRCEPMLEAFRAGADLHRRLGAQIAGVSEEEVTKEQRQAAKAANFGLLYGMGAEGFQAYSADAYGVEITLDEAQHTRERFFELWGGLRQWHLKTIAKAHRDGFVVSPLGRVRRVPGVWDSSDWMQQEAERQAVNSPVQGMASDLLQMGAASIAGVLPGSDPVAGVHLVGTVHDSIVCEVREDAWQELVAQAQERLTDLSRPLRRLGVELDVPIVADYAAGTRWGQSDIGEG